MCFLIFTGRSHPARSHVSSDIAAPFRLSGFGGILGSSYVLMPACYARRSSVPPRGALPRWVWTRGGTGRSSRSASTVARGTGACVHVVTPSPWGVHSHSYVTLHMVRAVLTLVSVTLADQVTRAGALLYLCAGALCLALWSRCVTVGVSLTRGCAPVTPVRSHRHPCTPERV